ncbi:MAG TPA: hypothetical protein DD409_11625, partial [Bacteroidales bacterium]|nr:hypothetical protein [Bacteroidales bacterium]
MNLNVDVRGMNDLASIGLFWSNAGKQTQAGTINAGLRFSRSASGKPGFKATFQPSELVIRDTVWQVHPATLQLTDDRIAVSAFQLSHLDEYIRIDGLASAQPTDTLFIAFNDFRLDDLVRMLPKSEMLFGGKITGVAACPHLLNKGTMVAELGVDHFSINEVVMGNLKASTQWNSSIKGLDLYGVIHTLPDGPSGG